MANLQVSALAAGARKQQLYRLQTASAPQPLRLGTSRSDGLCFRAGLAALERERDGDVMGYEW